MEDLRHSRILARRRFGDIGVTFIKGVYFAARLDAICTKSLAAMQSQRRYAIGLDRRSARTCLSPQRET